MKKALISAVTALSFLAPALGHAMILDEATVSKILGTRMPPSVVVVGTTKTPGYHSVHYFDNLINLTNRVLNRSIRNDVARVHVNPQSGEIYYNAARANQQAVEEHCQLRLTADGIQNAATECGNGFTR